MNKIRIDHCADAADTRIHAVQALTIYLFCSPQDISFPTPKTTNQERMCTSMKLKKRAATNKNVANSITCTFSNPSSVLARPRTNKSGISIQSNDLSTLVDQVLQHKQVQSSQQQQQVSSSLSPLSSLRTQQQHDDPASPNTCKRVRFDASTKTLSKLNPTFARNASALTTSQLLLQVRIVLQILDKNDPHLRHRLVQAIERCRRAMPKGRRFNRSVDAVMRRMVTPETYQAATKVRMRLAADAELKAICP